MKSNKAIFSPLGASNHSEHERAENDFYATDPVAIDGLLYMGAKINHNVWCLWRFCKRLLEVLPELWATNWLSLKTTRTKRATRMGVRKR